MVRAPRLTALLLALLPLPIAATNASDMVERFDAAVVGMSPEEGTAVAGQPRLRRSGADLGVERLLNIDVEFPGKIKGKMYRGFLHGEAAVFTRSAGHLDVTVMRNGDTEVVSFNAPESPGLPTESISADADQPSSRSRRSVNPGHFEDPAAYNLRFYFVKHDDLIDHAATSLHARYVAWWLADMAGNVLPAEPLRANYLEHLPWITSIAYGDSRSLDIFERTLKALDDFYGFDMERTYKNKYVLLTARPPMPGTTGVAFEGGNEAIASIVGRSRIVAHEVGHMLGATHRQAETRGWWGCETNMLAISSGRRDDCLEYTAANQRAMRSYMRHGPDSLAPRRMADAPPAQ